MPLKTDDLKTFETYKKAIKMDLTKISASGNTKFWVYKDIELPTASGGKQKLPTLISLVDDTAVKAVLKGKQSLCHGTCGLDGDKIAFEAVQGKVPYAILTKTVPLLFGKGVHVPSGADAESESEGEETVAPAGGSPDPRLAQLNNGWKQLSQQAAQKMAANPALRGALLAAMAGIPEMLQGGKVDEAHKRLEQLQSVLKASAGASAGQAGGVPQPGLVKYRGALVQFAQARSKVDGQIRALRGAILAEWPDDADLANDVAEEMEELNQELSAAVDEAIQAASNETSPATAAIKGKIHKYLAELASNAVIQKADSNPLGVSVTIGKTLGEALLRIRDAMPA